MLATKACNTRGRSRIEEKCEIRTDFQRDRDRVIHSKSFRRLKHKTQVFLSPLGDHYRTRLTHTLEVAQIARTIARGLNLNEDLVEAIALAHDLGHAPFGHAGERALNSISSMGFKHNEQSIRVVDRLERNLQGLNLTYEVRNGIVNHSSSKINNLSTLEGKIVNFSDKIAYVNHDIDDACRADILTSGELPKSCVEVLGSTKSERITTSVTSILENSKSDINMGEDVKKEQDKLRIFLFEKVYRNPVAKSEEMKVEGIIKKLYDHLFKNKDKLEKKYLLISESEGLERAILDYIAGMTDIYAISKYEEYYIPKFWDFN